MFYQPIFPLLGGSCFILCCALAVYLDFLDQKRDSKLEETDRVFIRYTSIITYDPRSRSARTFWVGTVFFLIGASFTGVWQSAIEDDSMMAISAIIMSLSLFLLCIGAWLYQVNRNVGTFVHMVLAGLFQVYALVYGFKAWMLSSSQYGDAATITQVRLILTCVACTCLVLSFITFRSVMSKTMLLIAHYQDLERTVLSEDKRLNCRKWIAAFATFQYTFGFCIAVILSSAVKDV